MLVDVSKMPEQWKIVTLIERWGYLSLEQICLLLGKNKNTIRNYSEILVKKELLRTDDLLKKKIFMPTRQTLKIIGRKNTAHIRPNFYELPHQDICVKFLASILNEVESYLTEREQKILDQDRKKYNDLELHLKNGKKIIVEVERTQKSWERYENIFFKLIPFLVDNYEIWWVVNSTKMEKVINTLITKENYLLEQQKIIMFKE